MRHVILDSALDLDPSQKHEAQYMWDNPCCFNEIKKTLVTLPGSVLIIVVGTQNSAWFESKPRNSNTSS